MVAPAVGSVVLVQFPFSDLSASKLRPAAVLAESSHRDSICAQITSNPYSDPEAIELTGADFSSGGLDRISYIRPGKLFTADERVFERTVANMTGQTFASVIEAIISLLRR